MNLTPTIIQEESWLVAGMSFYGDPFNSASGWSEENEIGHLWQRFMRFQTENPNAIQHKTHVDQFLEIHTLTHETEEKGFFEIFVGAAVSSLEHLPFDCLVKKLPATMYAVFSVEGKEIVSDWDKSIFEKWMPASPYQSAYPFSMQLYDSRFKGMDKLESSTLDIYIPIMPKKKPGESGQE